MPAEVKASPFASVNVPEPVNTGVSSMFPLNSNSAFFVTSPPSALKKGTRTTT